MATPPFYGNDKLYRKRKRACKTTAAVRAVNLNNNDDDDDGEDSDGSQISNDLQFNPTFSNILSYHPKKNRGTVDRYERLNVIGRGAHGVVYRARDTITGEIVAMKKANDGVSSSTEIDILKSLPRHPRIVELKEVVAAGPGDDSGVYIVMEFVEYDLHRYATKLKDGRRLTLAEIKSLMKQLLEGVEFLHKNMVMHRDLKPSNVLVSNRGELKICDFGLSRLFKSKTSSCYSSHVGSLQYRAPELLIGARKYSSEVDMWGVGCIMGELLLGRVLFRGVQTRAGQLETIYRVLGRPLEGRKGNFERKFCGDWLILKGDGFDLVSRFLSCDPTTRITAEDALDHLWFDDLSS